MIGLNYYSEYIQIGLYNVKVYVYIQGRLSYRLHRRASQAWRAMLKDFQIVILVYLQSFQ